MFKIKNKTPILVTTNNVPISAAKIKRAFENVADADIDIIESEFAAVRFGDVVSPKTSGDFAVYATGVLDGNGNRLLIGGSTHYPRACLGNILYIEYD